MLSENAERTIGEAAPAGDRRIAGEQKFSGAVGLIHRGRRGAAGQCLRQGRITCAAVLLVAVFAASASAGEADRGDDEAIVRAFQAGGPMHSTDEIVIDDKLRERFLADVDPQWQSRGEAWERETLLRLLSLRKAGKLPSGAEARGRRVSDKVAPAAEIAARLVIDRHGVSTDTLLCDPKLRRELQATAESIAGEVDAYAIRKLVLRLRKTRRLQPELVLRVADWDRTIETFSLDELAEALRTDGISSGAGVYIFRDLSGYLYVGEAINLRNRLKQHLAGSDRRSLSEYLAGNADGSVTVEVHSFGSESPGNQLVIRRAYESELIRSRSPRFNVRP